MADSSLLLLDGSDALQELSAPLALADFSLKLWTVRLDRLRGAVEGLMPILSPDERQRAARFATALLRERYAVSHAALRTVVGRQIDVEPRKVQFIYSVKGKPSLGGSNSSHGFSLSHCDDLALIGVVSGHELGVDLELVRARPDLMGIAERFFSPREAALLRHAPDAERTQLFYRLWTCKEAALKAVGEGITSGLNEPDISSVVADKGALDLRTSGISLRVCELAPSPEWAAAVAVASGA